MIVNTNKIHNIAFKGSIIDSYATTGGFRKYAGFQPVQNFNKSHLDTFTHSPLNVKVNGVSQQDNVVKMLVSSFDINAKLLFKKGVEYKIRKNEIAEQEKKTNKIVPLTQEDYASLCLDRNKAEIEANKALLEFCKQDSERYFPIAQCFASDVENAKNINNLMRKSEIKFVGLRFDPEVLSKKADGNAYGPYFRLARRYKLPVIFHSELNPDKINANRIHEHHSNPMFIYQAAKEYPDLPVVIGHMAAGNEQAHVHAMDVLLQSIDKKDARLYVDISWVDWANNGISSSNKPTLVKLIKELQKRNALDRILFGTDAPLGCFGESPAGGLSPKQAYEKVVGDIKTAIKQNFGKDADEIIDKIFFKNADDLFFKKSWTIIPRPDELKHMSVAKVSAICVGVLGGMGLLSSFYDKYMKVPKTRKEKLNI